MTCDRPSKSRNAGGLVVQKPDEDCIVLTRTHRYTLDTHSPKIPPLTQIPWLSALIISISHWWQDALWCNYVSSFYASKGVLKLLPTHILVYLSNSWSDAWSLPALKERTIRDHQSLTGAFQIVFSSARRTITEPNHFHDSLSAGRDSWPELVILRCRPQGWTGAFVGHRRQDCAGGDHFKGFELLFP